MKKRRKTAFFLRVLRTKLYALGVIFTLNFANAADIFDENTNLMCSFTGDDTQIVAKYCKECSAESLETTDCSLTVENKECVYSAQCLPGYENLDNSDPTNPSCTMCPNSENVAIWDDDCQIETCELGYVNVDNTCVSENIDITYDCGAGTGGGNLHDRMEQAVR